MEPPPCDYCGEPLLAGERCAPWQSTHHECAFRMVAGSLAHILHRCTCYDKLHGEQHLDPPGLTKRQAARASLAAFQVVEALWHSYYPVKLEVPKS